MTTTCPHGQRCKTDCPECHRAYNRAWCQRRRDAARSAENQTRTTCSLRTCRGQLREHVDSLGRLEVSCPTCERRQAGICRDCPRPVAGRRGLATRCAECRDAARKRQEVAARVRRDPVKRARTDRRRARRPEVRQRRAAQRRAWRQANPDRVRAHKRRAALNPTPRQRERERYWNSQPERIQQKREHARRRYYERHPERPAPVCDACELAIEYSGTGRPPKYHLECSPWKRQRKGYQSLAQERAA